MKTCIVLGSKGFVGSAIVRQATARGYKCIDVDIDNYAERIGSAAPLLINANGNSKKFLATEKPADEFDLSVRSVMRSLHDFSCDKYVHLSTMDVYPDRGSIENNKEDAILDGNDASAYGLHKRMAESLVEYYATDWVTFRMSGFVGPGLKKNSIYDMLTGTPLRVGINSQYQYILTDDLANIVLDVAERDMTREILNVGGRGVISLRDVADLIPGYELRYHGTPSPADEYCEVNLAKIAAVTTLPRTRNTVERFVGQVLAGEIKLS